MSERERHREGIKTQRLIDEVRKIILRDREGEGGAVTYKTLWCYRIYDRLLDEDDVVRVGKLLNEFKGSDWFEIEVFERLHEVEFAYRIERGFGFRKEGFVLAGRFKDYRRQFLVYVQIAFWDTVDWFLKRAYVKLEKLKNLLNELESENKAKRMP